MGYKNLTNAEYQQNWHVLHPGYRSEMRKRIREREKDEVFLHYGGYVCSCCGFAEKEALVLDHINGGGRKHRESIGSTSSNRFYRWIIKNHFPPGFQVLCANCNMAKGSKDKCPINHKRSAV